MRRGLLITVVLAVAAPVFAQVFADYFPGEYAFYIDERGESRFYRGYYFYRIRDSGEEGFLVRNLNLASGEQMGMIVAVAADAAGTLRITRLTGADESTPPAFAQGYVDLLDFAATYHRNRMRIGVDSSIDEARKDYTLTFRCSKLLPLFRFQSITKRGDPRPSYTLDRAGVMDPAESAQFWNMRPLSEIAETPRPEPPVLEARAPVAVQLNGYSLSLDDRWDRHEETPFVSYWLTEQSSRDSLVMIERSSWGKFRDLGFGSLADYVRLSLLIYGTTLFSTVEASEKDGHITVSFESFDQDNVRNFARLENWIEGDDLLTMNLASFASIYRRNLQYYQRIVESLRRAGQTTR